MVETFLSSRPGNHSEGPLSRVALTTLIGCLMWTVCWTYMPFLCVRAVLLTAAQPPERRPDGVEVDIVHALLQRNDCIVRDLDVLRTHLRAALCDVAVTDTGFAFQQGSPVERVLRMHFQPRDPDHEPRTVENALRVVVAQHVADVLAQKALDALAELHAPLED